jgi:hypothetical protein
MHWLDRLAHSFFNFVEDHSYWCHYPLCPRHYQDNIRVDTYRAYWYLHGNLIAKLTNLWPREGYELYLTDAGWPTLTTMSRISAILSKLEDILGRELDVGMWLKFTPPPRVQPMYTYVYVGGRTYKTGEMTIRFKPEEGTYDVEVDWSEEFWMFRDHRELSYIASLYRRARRLSLTADDLMEELERAVERLDLPMELRHDVNSTILRLNELSEGLKRFGRASGLRDHGLYVRFFKPEDVKEKLKEYIRELEGEIDRAKGILATLRLIS